jgi:hypothetical protein
MSITLFYKQRGRDTVRRGWCGPVVLMWLVFCGWFDSRFESCCMGLESCANVFIRGVGPIYVVIASSLITAVGYMYYTVVLPQHHPLYSAQGMMHATLEFALIFNLLFNYAYCVRTDPGLPPAVLVRPLPAHIFSYASYLSCRSSFFQRRTHHA